MVLAMRPPWFVYLLRCRDGSLYTGITLDLKRRLAEHRSGKGSKCLRGKLPVKLVHHERHSTRSLALRREAAIKKMPRTLKLKLLK